MDIATLSVENRPVSGTNRVRSLRNSGKIPMVLYGGGKDAVSLQADYDSVKRHLAHRRRVYKLQLADGKEQPGFLKAVQWDCLTDEPLHIDLQRIELDKPLDLQIELVVVGRPAGETKGGRLVVDLKKLELACMPDSVPHEIEVRVSDLQCGAKLRAGDLPLPSGVSLRMPADRLVLHVTDPGD